MDYKETARQVYEKIGGKENLISAAHCATRLRLVIRDNNLCDNKAVENIDGVKGVFFASGQLQIIFGTGTVNKVYDAFIEIAGITESTKEDVKQAANAGKIFLSGRLKHWEIFLFRLFLPLWPAVS